MKSSSYQLWLGCVLVILSLAKVRSCFCSISKSSSCRAWMDLVAGARKWEGAAACIGSTSATAARKAGLTRIFYPESPGIEGCVISSQTLPLSSFLKYIMFQTAARSMQYHNTCHQVVLHFCCRILTQNCVLAFSLHVFTRAYCFEARCFFKLRKTIWLCETP